MTRHINLLASVPKPAARAHGLPAALPPALLGVALLVLAAAALWSRQTDAALRDELQAAKQAVRADDASQTGGLDAAVLAALALKVDEREAQAAALAGAASGKQEAASAWLDALDAAGADGLAINQARIEPGPRLTLTGSALQPGDIHAFLARLQKHPLTGRAAIGQLEVRRGDAADVPLNFRLAPPTPEVATALPVTHDGQAVRR